MTQSDRLAKYLDEIASYIPEFKKQNATVSASTLGWQIDHSLKAINGVINILKQAPTNKRPKISVYGRIFLALRYFPRGKARAPKYVLPPENIKETGLNAQLTLAKEQIHLLSGFSDKVTFKHPLFGVLNKSQTIRFLEVHTYHHLKIMRDIIKQK